MWKIDLMWHTQRASRTSTRVHPRTTNNTMTVYSSPSLAGICLLFCSNSRSNYTLLQRVQPYGDSSATRTIKQQSFTFHILSSSSMNSSIRILLLAGGRSLEGCVIFAIYPNHFVWQISAAFPGDHRHWHSPCPHLGPTLSS